MPTRDLPRHHLHSRSLYICYFGVREPLVQTQVLPYLRELVAGGVRISLLTFEPDLKERWNGDALVQWKERLAAEGINWCVLAYHRRPALTAKLYDIAAGAWYAARIARQQQITIFHGRSHVGAAIATLAKRLVGGLVIFDFRGFLADEYVDSGHWPASGYLSRLAKWAERRLCRAADAMVVLTERARDMLRDTARRGRPIEVIPCCVDLARFAAAAAHRARTRDELGVRERLVCVFAGSIGGAYLWPETARFLQIARAADPRVYALVLTPSPADEVAAELLRAGLTANDFRVQSATPEEIPRYLTAADIGLAVLRPGRGRLGSSPTKIGEYLAAGLPIVTTAGIGDLDSQIEQTRVGVLLRSFDPPALADAFAAIQTLRTDPDLGTRCRHEALTRYDLTTIGGERYRRLYEAVTTCRPLRVLALASYPVESPATHFRLVQHIEPLAARGIDVRFSPFLDSRLFASLYEPRRMLARLPLLAMAVMRRFVQALSAARADVVFVQREAMFFGPPLVEWTAARLLRRPLVLDLDDATYLRVDSPVYGRLATWLKWPGKTDQLIRWSRLVTCGNPTIEEYVRSRHRNVELLANVVDTSVFRPACVERDVPLIGWIGTHTTYPFFERLLPLFERLARDIRFRVVIVGSRRTGVTVPGVEVETRAWTVERDAEDFRSLDIGVYPMADDAWSAGKSGLKAVQYMASGVPFVMSPVGMGATMGVPGTTHFLATTDDEWLTALRRLLTDLPLRRRMGREARTFAEQHHSIDQYADRLASILRAAS